MSRVTVRLLFSEPAGSVNNIQFWHVLLSNSGLITVSFLFFGSGGEIGSLGR